MGQLIPAVISVHERLKVMGRLCLASAAARRTILLCKSPFQWWRFSLPGRGLATVWFLDCAQPPAVLWMDRLLRFHIWLAIQMMRAAQLCSVSGRFAAHVTKRLVSLVLALSKARRLRDK